MNETDIIISVLLVYAVFKGWTGGILVQLAGIAGIFAGIWAASYCSERVASFLGMESASAEVMYIVTLVIVMVAVALLLRLMDRLLKSIGLSVPLRILGVVFSLGKWTLILALLLSVYMSVADVWRIAPSKAVTGSVFYRPLVTVRDNVFPYLEGFTRDIKFPPVQLPDMEHENTQEPDSLRIENLQTV